MGFLGTGWIGRHRLRAIAASGTGDICAVADPSDAALYDACEGLNIRPRIATSLTEMLDRSDLDGVVIATPSPLHADQCIEALERGVAVFCQHPIGATATETRRIVDAARDSDQLLCADLAYRFTCGMVGIRDIVRCGELGDVYGVDLVFHTTIGPDRHCFHDVAVSGDGCVIDLGSHMIDLALWTLDFPTLRTATGRVYSNGKPIRWTTRDVEDYAVARLDLDSGASVQLACSWSQPAGRQSSISATFHGTRGVAEFRNVRGSFYEFVAEHYRGTSREAFAEPNPDWAGGAAIDWARRLGAGARFDPAASRLVELAATVDRIYGR